VARAFFWSFGSAEQRRLPPHGHQLSHVAWPSSVPGPVIATFRCSCAYTKAE